MTCLECGTEMKVTNGPHIFDEGGLRVRLLNVEKQDCPKCGEQYVGIPRMSQLIETIAMSIVRKPTALAGVEIKFLRDFLGQTGAELADSLATTKETISRWENGKHPITTTFDRLLRAYVVMKNPSASKADLVQCLEAIKNSLATPPKTIPKPAQLKMQPSKKSWDLVPA